MIETEGRTEALEQATQFVTGGENGSAVVFEFGDKGDRVGFATRKETAQLRSAAAKLETHFREIVVLSPPKYGAKQPAKKKGGTVMTPAATAFEGGNGNGK